MKTLARYTANHGITVEIVSGPDTARDEDGWEHYAYVLRLTNADLGTTMTLPWRQGLAVTTDPDESPEEILNVLITDSWDFYSACCWQEGGYELGMEIDSETQRRYGDVGMQAEVFADFIGGRAEIERLALNYERL